MERKRLNIPPFDTETIHPEIERVIRERKGTKETPTKTPIKGAIKGQMVPVISEKELSEETPTKPPIKGAIKGTTERPKRVVLSRVVPGKTYIPEGGYKGKRVKINLTTELYELLKRQCKESGIGESEMVRVALWQVLK